MELLTTLIMLGGVVVVFYFFVLRPQKKQERQTKDMLDNLTVGDEITTIGGIIGKVVRIIDDTCVIETSRDRTKLHILKSAVRCVDRPVQDIVDDGKKAK